MLLISFLSIIPVTPIFAGAGAAAAVVFSSRNQAFRKSSVKPAADKEKKVETVAPIENQNETRDYLCEDIVLLFEKKQIFLRQGLKIDDVARECMTNRTYVSNCINSHYGQSFTTLVNSFRVNYAKELIKRYGNSRKLSAISEEAGFSDEVSFIRNFKKFTGMTPSSWGAEIYS